ncbi:hypothetical protein TTHERM_01503030 (macronuclear) [Tetrahymena thermophila SB210]|uniref:Transmembrane protein n=1 Tax=Tetrahymena thermophila (strain SB210) TaxID=312017 RepID=Q228S1_TETTS|nr:hypothetical protein TTHERM_01503030 [Tetrahymena thermophila SB210]EAR81785.1 hypothetical protein TTHERM_01503030 [Tetrahymena thermophila SB210]|eukprot:XP_001029448.1 hypothetical protein TTHERM_01503030 [Tetrahymena thermophila SB210]
MKIKYILLLVICLLSFCTSQETNLKQKLPEETNGDTEEGETIEENNKNYEEDLERQRREEEDGDDDDDGAIDLDCQYNPKTNLVECYTKEDLQEINDKKDDANENKNQKVEEEQNLSETIEENDEEESREEDKDGDDDDDGAIELDCQYNPETDLIECYDKEDLQEINDKKDNANENKNQKVEEEYNLRHGDEEGNSNEEIENLDIEKTEDQKTYISIISFTFLGLFQILF